MSSSEIDTARDDVLRTRAQLSDTISQLTNRVTTPITTAKEKLNVMEAVRNNPWPAIAVAVGAGALLAASGADARAASAAVSAGQAGVEGAKKLAQSATESARSAPSKSRQAFGDACDSVAARLVTSMINTFKADASAQTPVPVTTAVGYVENPAPAHVDA